MIVVLVLVHAKTWFMVKRGKVLLFLATDIRILDSEQKLK